MIKSFIKKSVAVLIVLILLLSCSVCAVEFSDASTGKSLNITATGAILIDLDTNTILYKRNINNECRPASLTKMMTLLVAYEQLSSRLDELVSITSEMIEVPKDSSCADLRRGDKISIHDLLYAMMLPSGNDAAKSLAYIVSGNEENFALLMNAKALELGMTSSSFKNAHGFDENGHYTTTKDLGILSVELCKIPALVEIFSSYKYTATIYPDGDLNAPTKTTWYNSNNMLNPNSYLHFDGLKGIKTGYTNLAGNCLASYYEKDGRRLVCVVTHSDAKHRDSDTKTVIKYGLDNFDTFNVKDVFSQKRIIIDLENASLTDDSNGQLELYLDGGEDKYITVSKSEGNKIRTFDENTITIRYPVIKAPIKAGDNAGKVEFIYNNEVLFASSVLASRSVDAEIESPRDLVSMGIEGKTRISWSFLTNKYFIIIFSASLVLIIAAAVLFTLRRRQVLRIRLRQKNGIKRSRRRGSML